MSLWIVWSTIIKVSSNQFDVNVKARTKNKLKLSKLATYWFQFQFEEGVLWADKSDTTPKELVNTRNLPWNIWYILCVLITT